MQNLWQDVRYAVRVLARNPGFTAVAVLSLAIGIGGNTAVFSVVDALWFEPLPVRNPEELVVFSRNIPQGNFSLPVSYAQFQEFRLRSRVLSDMFASYFPSETEMTVVDGGGEMPESVETEHVSSGFFSTLGVEARLGRTFTEDDDRLEDPPQVAVLNHGFWQRRFGGDPNVIGQRITLNGLGFSIIGVTPPGFSGFLVGPSQDLWIPLSNIGRVNPGGFGDLILTGNSPMLLMMARLGPGVRMDQARAEVSVIDRQILEQEAAERGSGWTPVERERFFERRLEIESGRAGWSPMRVLFSEAWFLLIATVGLVLLIACANVGGLLLARGAARREELKVRLALGSGTTRLVCQLLTEGMVIAIPAGVVGLGIAFWGVYSFPTHVDAGALGVDVNIRVLGFTLGVSLLSVLVFALVPALKQTRAGSRALENRNSFAGDPGSRWTLNRFLLVFQVAVSLMLLVGAGLFARTFQNLLSLDTDPTRKTSSSSILIPDPVQPARVLPNGATCSGRCCPVWRRFRVSNRPLFRPSVC